VTVPLPIGQLLIQRGYIDQWQLQSALAHQRRWGGRIGAALVNLGFISEPLLLTELARQLGVPYLRLGNRRVPDAIVRLVPAKLIRSRKVFPVAFAWHGNRNVLVIMTSDPQNLIALDEVAFTSGKAITAALAGDLDLEQAIERHLGPGPSGASHASAPTPAGGACRAA
jgi:hypothetical protein